MDKGILNSQERAVAWQSRARATYHAMDARGYCGAACVQMILGAITGRIPSQKLLMAQAEEIQDRARQSDWFTSPVAAFLLLNDHLDQVRDTGGQSVQRVWYDLVEIASLDEFTEMLAKNLQKHRRPVMLSTKKGDHWELALQARHEAERWFFEVDDPSPSLEEVSEQSGQYWRSFVETVEQQGHSYNDCCSHVPLRQSVRWCTARALRDLGVQVKRSGAWENLHVALIPTDVEPPWYRRLRGLLREPPEPAADGPLCPQNPLDERIVS